MILACVFAATLAFFAQASAENSKRMSSRNFAVAVAESVSKYESPSQDTIMSCSDESEEFLGIIGRTDGTKIDFSDYGAEEVFLCDDNRFFMRFNSAKKLEDCLCSLSAKPQILYAVQDCAVYTCEETSDPQTGNAHLSWGSEAMEVDVYSEYLKDFDSEEVVVAIIDSGVAELDAFSGRLVSGYDFADNDSDPSNDVHPGSHGTFLTSIVVDCTPNLPIKIMPVRVMRSTTGSLMNVINGIYYAVDEGADVINISLGGKLVDCTVMDDAVVYALENDVAVVVCAGNEHNDTQLFCPAHNDDVITVSAVDDKLNFASNFSNYGAAVDISAPGVNINGYDARGNEKDDSGTSMSTAYISACVAMVRLNYPELNVYQAEEVLKSGTVDLGEEGRDQYYGNGFPKLSKLAKKIDTVWVSGIETDNGIELTEGDIFTLSYTISPENATDKSVLWRSLDENIATVTDGEVRAIAPGKTEIIAETVDGKYKAVCEVNVYSRYPDSLSIISLPHKTDYYCGEELSLDGLELEVQFADGTHKKVDVSQCDISGYDSETIGNQEVLIEYGDVTASFTVNVKRTWWQTILWFFSFEWLFCD